MRYRAFKNISILGLGTATGAFCAFAAQVLFARHLGPADYGSLSSVFAAVNLVVPIAGFGLGAWWLRAFGAEGWAARRWILPSLRLLAATCVVACGLVLLWGRSYAASDVGALVPLMTPLVLVVALNGLVVARLQLEERYAAQALWYAMPNLWKVGIALAALALGLSLKGIAAGFLLSAILILSASLANLRGFRPGALALVGHGPESSAPAPPATPSLASTASEAWPFALAGVFYLIYFQSDILLLYHFSGSAAVGVYTVAVSVLSALYLVPSLVYQQYLLPKQHRWAEHDPARFLRVFRFGAAVMLALGLVAMALLVLVAPHMILALWGPPYARSAQLLVVLAACVPLRFLATSVGGTLVTRDNMRRKVWYQGVVALVNIGLNLMWIPRWGYVGAALSTVVCELCLLLMYLLAVRGHVFGADAWRGWSWRTDGIDGLA